MWATTTTDGGVDGDANERGAKADDIKGTHPRAAPAKIGARPIPVLIERQLKLPEIECSREDDSVIVG